MKVIILSLSLFLITSCSIFTNTKPEFFSFPNVVSIPIGKTGQVVKRKQFTLQYNNNCKVSNWVSYRVLRSNLLNNIGRTGDFRKDNKILGEQASLSDYKNSRYDRGHLARANLFTENYESMSTSFLLSNIIPQLKSNNRYGAWKKLEKLEFENIQTRGELLIVSGPVFSLNPKRLGGNKVCVPKSLFKVMLDPNKGDAIGFIIPNDYEVKSYDSFSMSVNEVEKVVGLDFFSELHDEFEETIESESKLLSWVKEASKSNFSINSKDLILSDGYNCGHSMYLTKSNRCYATKAGLKKRVKGVCCDKYLH